MSRVLVDYAWRSRNRTKRPWALWLDGRIHELKLGEDYAGSDKSFAIQVYSMAKKRGLKARVSQPEKGVTVVQAYPKQEEKA